MRKKISPNDLFPAMKQDVNHEILIYSHKGIAVEMTLANIQTPHLYTVYFIF
jgi:hypothetical protein